MSHRCRVRWWWRRRLVSLQVLWAGAFVAFVVVAVALLDHRANQLPATKETRAIVRLGVAARR